MKLLFSLIIPIFLVNLTFAQNAAFVVEVGAFAEPVSIHYFDKLQNVYEVVGINNIYRYRIDTEDINTANSLKKEAIEKGYIHSRIIDIQTVKDHCSAECGYTPPKPTGRGTIGLENANMYELKSKKPQNIVDNNKDDATNNNNGNIDLENANMYELKSKNGEIDIVDISKFEFKKGEKIECLFFDYDSYFLRDKSKTELNKLAWFLSKNKKHTLNIRSYTDARGGDVYNQNLAKKRANMTKKYLTRLGVSSSQITTEIYGEQKPIAINETLDGHDCEEGRQYNRRIELTVLDANKKTIDVVEHIYVPEPLRMDSNK